MTSSRPLACRDPRSTLFRRLRIGLLVTAVGVTLALPAAAQWKWRDKTGRTQYSDTPPPPDLAERDILQRPAAALRRTGPAGGAVAGAGAAGSAAANGAGAASTASAPPLLPQRTSDPELEARRRKIELEAADKQRAEEARIAAAKVQNCATARQAKRTADSGQRLARIDENGERVYLNDAERAASVQRAEAVIDANCR